MGDISEDYSCWATEEAENCNVYSALSNNLKKYESIYRSYGGKNNKVKLLTPIDQNKLSHKLVTLNPSVEVMVKYNEDKKDSMKHKQNEGQRKKMMNWLQNSDCENQNILNHQDSKDFKPRGYSRATRSSHQSRDQPHALKLKQFKFQKRDKKKFKDRCVELYAQMKNKNKFSLKEVDSINKQCKKEKIELFLKLLRR